MEKEFLVSKEAEGLRLDKFLAGCLPSFSRAKISCLIQRGSVLVDGGLKKPGFRLKSQEKLVVVLEQEKKLLRPFDFAVKIIYEDSDIIIVDKPGGLTTHPPQSEYDQTLVNALLGMGKKLVGPEALRPGVVHRLDKETSGVIVLAKNMKSYEALVSEFKQRRVRKEYRAICQGLIKRDEFTVNLPLARDSRNRLKMKVSFAKSKEALTALKVIERFKDTTYLSLKILTGRMHQIRVHLKFLGHPVLGDKKYVIKNGQDTLLLHSYRLAFRHPRHKKNVEAEAPLPERFQVYLKEKRCIQ